MQIGAVQAFGTGAVTAEKLAPAQSPLGAGEGSAFAQFSEILNAGEKAAIGAINGQVPMSEAINKVLESERMLTTVIAARDKFVNAYLELTRMQI
jgi:flagellar hook-basal body complex protein FliE